MLGVIILDYLSSDVRMQLPVQQMMEVTRVNTWTPVMGSWYPYTETQNMLQSNNPNSSTLTR